MEPLTHPDASIAIEDHQGKRVISVAMQTDVFTPKTTWTTAYSMDLIAHVLRVKGPAYLCDEICRDEDPQAIQRRFQWDLLSYAAPADFAGRRVLDFGSGSGASSMVLTRMFPEAQIVGVELMPEFVELARHRARFYGVEDRVQFHLSPDSHRLPDGLGTFDAIMFSAVYEHLLPRERAMILPLLWSHLKPNGLIFLGETPYRWFPIEGHTTGLPLLNYLPDRLALAAARRWSARVRPTATWEDLLRAGIRGGTPREILAILNRDGRIARLLTPSRHGITDRIDLWYQIPSTTRRAWAKTSLMWGLRALKAVTGVTMLPALSLAIQKVR